MDTASKNKIHNALLEFEFKSLDTDEMNSNYFVDWAKENILEAIDYHSNNLIDKEHIVQIPSLSIDIDLSIKNKFFRDSKELKSLISQKIQTALKESLSIFTELDEPFSDSGVRKLTVKNYKSMAVLNFIQSGQCDQNYTIDEWKEYINTFFEELLVNEALAKKWLKTIENKDSFYRFFNLKSPSDLIDFVSKWTQENNFDNWLNDVIELFDLNPKIFNSIAKSDFYYLFFNHYLSAENSLELIFQKIIQLQLVNEKVRIKDFILPKKESSHIFKLLKGMDSIEKSNDNSELIQVKSEDKSQEVLNQGAFINQAGIVILTPFLTELLKNVGYVNKDGQLIKQKGLPILLHYIATGETETPEWKLTLPKILAGLRPGQHCDTVIFPDNDLNEQINELLRAVIVHWSALQNTSQEGLRESFLFREGTLKFKNGFYYLYIKEKAFDILLSFIPWNYTTIKLDWMQDIIFVEWKTNS